MLFYLFYLILYLESHKHRLFQKRLNLGSDTNLSRPDSRSDPIGESEPVSGSERLYLILFTCFFFFSELNLYLWVYKQFFCNNQNSFTYTNTYTCTYLIQTSEITEKSAGEHLSLRWPVLLVWNVLSSLSPLQYLHGLNTRAKIYA